MQQIELRIDRDRPARPVNISERIGGRAVLLGWSVKATGGATAEVDILNGQDAGGMLVVAVALAIGASSTQWLGGQGLTMDNGIFCNVVSGAVSGSVWIADGWKT